MREHSAPSARADAHVRPADVSLTLHPGSARSVNEEAACHG